MKLHEFLVLINKKRSSIDFLINANVINETLKCEHCGNIINLNIDNLEFKCTKCYYVMDSHKKKKKLQCNFRQSMRKNTWFSRSKMSIEKICMFVAYFIMLKPPRQNF